MTTATAPAMDSAAEARAVLIACDNDHFRRAQMGQGTTYLRRNTVATLGIGNLPDETRAAIIEALCDFEGWEPGNDPYDEHDFVALTVRGERILAKIDYFDGPDCRFGSEDPTDTPREIDGLALDPAEIGRSPAAKTAKMTTVADRFATFRETADAEKAAILAKAVARCLGGGLSDNPDTALFNAIAVMAGANIRAEWTPTAVFFDKLPKAKLIEIAADLIADATRTARQGQEGENREDAWGLLRGPGEEDLSLSRRADRPLQGPE